MKNNRESLLALKSHAPLFGESKMLGLNPPPISKARIEN
jgi:hypothetical protein